MDLLNWRHHPDLNWGIKLLQSSALPLGYGAENIMSTINSAHFWSGLRDSNSLPPPWQGGALPDELNPQIMVLPDGIEPSTRGFSVPCSTD